MAKPPKYIVRQPVELPTSARSLVKLAGILGIWVEARSPRKRLGYIQVAGIDRLRGIAFSATWLDGKTTGAELYRREAVYELVVDGRPEHDARVPNPKRKGQTIPAPGRKPAGIGTHRYRYQRLSVLRSSWRPSRLYNDRHEQRDPRHRARG